MQKTPLLYMLDFTEIATHVPDGKLIHEDEDAVEAMYELRDSIPQEFKLAVGEMIANSMTASESYLLEDLIFVLKTFGVERYEIVPKYLPDWVGNPKNKSWLSYN